MKNWPLAIMKSRNFKLNPYSKTLVAQVLEPFGTRKAVLLALLSSWLPAILYVRIFGTHLNLRDDGSIGIVRVLLDVFIMTLCYAEIGSYIEKDFSYPHMDGLSHARANLAITANVLWLIVLVLLFPLLTLYVSGTPRGFMPFMVHQYLREFPGSAYHGLQGIVVGKTMIRDAALFRLNVAPLLAINVLSVYRRKGKVIPRA